MQHLWSMPWKCLESHLPHRCHRCRAHVLHRLIQVLSQLIEPLPAAPGQWQHIEECIHLAAGNLLNSLNAVPKFEKPVWKFWENVWKVFTFVRAWSSFLSVTGVADSGKRSAQRTCCKLGRNLWLHKGYWQNSKETCYNKSFLWLEGVVPVSALGFVLTCSFFSCYPFLFFGFIWITPPNPCPSPSPRPTTYYLLLTTYYLLLPTNYFLLTTSY